MPRKGSPGRRKVVADAKYSSPLVTQLINRVMLDGKRSLAERIVYDALESISERTQGGDPISVLKRAVDNVRPQLEVKSRRVGGATYQVPIEVRPGRSTTLALRWIIAYARIRREHTWVDALQANCLMHLTVWAQQ